MAIRQIEIRRYRGLAAFSWDPTPGINCLVGPGDAGKSTVLSAIDLLLSTTPYPQVSEFDYFRRRVSEGFEVRAVLGDLDPEVDRVLRVPLFHGWKDGKLHQLPDEDGAEKVLVVRVVGSPELEVSHQVVAPSEDPGRELPFRVELRRLCRHAAIASSSRAIRELGLSRGSLLAQFVGDAGVRAAVSTAISGASEKLQWPGDVESALGKLRELFGTAGLPAALHLGILPNQDRSLVALVGLLSGEPRGESVPLTHAGSGTRQAVMFHLAAALLERASILTIDEPETALEPYRQRALIAELRGRIGETGQAFVTTHSPAVLGAVGWGHVSRLVSGSPGPTLLRGELLRSLYEGDPDAFLARIPVVCEGATEVGLLQVLLPHVAGSDAGVLDRRGIHLADGEGNRCAIDRANQLLDLGIQCAVFLDNEADNVGRRASLRDRLGAAFTAWTDCRNVEEALSKTMTIERLTELAKLAASLAERSEVSLIQQIRQQAGRAGQGAVADLVEEVGEDVVRAAFAFVMDKRSWFKGAERGRALAGFLIRTGVPDPVLQLVQSCWKGLDASVP